jgi:6-phosphogluconolactonase
MFVYVGAYTEPPLGRARGIEVFRFDAAIGALDHVQTVSNVPNPSFLTLDAQQRILYAVNELAKGRVTAFARDSASGDLRPLNQQPTHGADPCYISLDPTGRYALVANYTGGNVTVLPVAADGSLGPATAVLCHEGSGPRPQQQSAHPHMIAPTPDGRFVLVTDLGADQMVIYRLDTETGQLVPNDRGLSVVAGPPGSGPRHFAFSPNGRTLYVINELASTLSVYAYDGERGDLRPLQTVSTLPDDFHGENDCAHVAVSPDGRFVYGSNRGHDSIAIWAVDPASGELTLVGHEPTRGQTPRNFTLDPSGDWLLAANQESDTIVTFRRDPDTGKLTPAGPVTSTASPVAILFSRT